MNQKELLILINRVADKTATADELAQYNAWCDALGQQETLVSDPEARKSAMLAHIHREIGNKTVIRRVWPRIAAAASILLFLSAGAYLLLHHRQPQQTAQIVRNDLAPGGNKAILTLSNGRKIVLTGAKNGQLATQGNMVINKTANGQVIYSNSKVSPTGGDLAGTIAYNTMTTPRGGQYHLTLADGSNVWLNAASSIKYPTAFTGKDRPVEITGEAYFEVAHNAAKPFRVKVKDQIVEVLGTHFNVNAYNDEPSLNTTLLEGKVKVSKANNWAVYLLPGHQAVNNGKELSVQDADTEQAVAWKNGFFQFDHADLYVVMRQLSRWYDVDVAYVGNIPNRVFSGKVHRNLNAAESLQMLQYFKVNYQIRGKKITITA